MPKVEVSESIARPIDEVWAYVSDPHSMTEWMASVTDVELIDGEELQAGSRFRETDRFLGRSLEFVQEVSEYDPPARLTFESVSGPFEAQVGVELKADGLSTRVTVLAQAEGGLGGIFGKLVDPVVSAAFRRETQGDLTRLKDILESQQAEVTS